MNKVLSLTFLLLAAGINTLFAQSGSGILKVRLSDNSPVYISVDGQNYNQANGGSLSVNDLQPGTHEVQVFRQQVKENVRVALLKNFTAITAANTTTAYVVDVNSGDVTLQTRGGGDGRGGDRGGSGNGSGQTGNGGNNAGTGNGSPDADNKVSPSNGLNTIGKGGTTRYIDRRLDNGTGTTNALGSTRDHGNNGSGNDRGNTGSNNGQNTGSGDNRNNANAGGSNSNTGGSWQGNNNNSGNNNSGNGRGNNGGSYGNGQGNNSGNGYGNNQGNNNNNGNNNDGRGDNRNGNGQGNQSGYPNGGGYNDRNNNNNTSYGSDRSNWNRGDRNDDRNYNGGNGNYGGGRNHGRNDDRGYNGRNDDRQDDDMQEPALVLLTAKDIAAIKVKVAKKATDAAKSSTLQTEIGDRAFSTEQARGMIRLLKGETARLQFARWAIDGTTDVENFGKLNTEFKLAANKREIKKLAAEALQD